MSFYPLPEGCFALGEVPERIKGSTEQGLQFVLLVTEICPALVEAPGEEQKNDFLVLSGVYMVDKQEVVGFALCSTRKKHGNI